MSLYTLISLKIEFLTFNELEFPIYVNITLEFSYEEYEIL